LLWGFFALVQQAGLITYSPNLWYVVLIFIGILLIAGAAYRMSRQKPAQT
jgi:amino acid transporter